jgi:hypothetical protein
MVLRKHTPAHALQGEDKRQGQLRDPRGGTYDATPAAGTHKQMVERRTVHEQAQRGADVRPEAVIAQDGDLPEGLERERKGPYNRKTGRAKER